MDIDKLIPKDLENKLSGSLSNIQEWTKIVISDDEALQASINAMNLFKTEVNEVEKTKKEITKEWAQKKKVVDSWVKERVDKLKHGIELLGNGISKYQLAKKREIEEAQRKAQLAAALKAQREAAAIKKEQDRIEALIAKGREDLAIKAQAKVEAIIDNANSVVTPVVIETKPENASFSEVYKLVVFDKETLLKDLVAKGLYDFVDIKVAQLERKKNNEKLFELAGCAFNPFIKTIKK